MTVFASLFQYWRPLQQSAFRFGWGVWVGDFWNEQNKKEIYNSYFYCEFLGLRFFEFHITKNGRFWKTIIIVRKRASESIAKSTLNFLWEFVMLKISKISIIHNMYIYMQTFILCRNYFFLYFYEMSRGDEYV